VHEALGLSANGRELARKTLRGAAPTRHTADLLTAVSERIFAKAVPAPPFISACAPPPRRA